MTECNLITFRIVIVGIGITGSSIVYFLNKYGNTSHNDLLKKCEVIFLEDEEIIGTGGSFDQSIGAQNLSFNISEEVVSSYLNSICEDEYLLRPCEDALLSNTNERPHGWNRSTGQWKQYKLSDRTSYSKLIQKNLSINESFQLDIRFSTKVIQVYLTVCLNLSIGRFTF